MTDDNDAPMVFATFDRITAKDATYKKTVLLHSMTKPELTEDGKVIITNKKDGNSGKLVAMTLHTDMTATVFGDGDGSEYDINGVSYKPSSYDPNDPDYRIELCPSEPRLTDRILTLMYVTDAENTAPVLNYEALETPELMGAKILDRVLLFSKDGGALKGELTLPELKDGPLTYYVAGVEMGEWTVYTDGIPTDKAVANGTDGIISFSVEKGKITLKLS